MVLDQSLKGDVMKLEIDIDENCLQNLKDLKHLDASATCIGDVIRNLISAEAKKKGLVSKPYVKQMKEVFAVNSRDGWDEIFSGIFGTTFGRSK